MVLPVPGGPQSSSDIGASLSTSLRNGVPVLVRCCWPITSSRVRGRIRTASGAAALAAASSASSNRLSDCASASPPLSRLWPSSDLIPALGASYPQDGDTRSELSTGSANGLPMLRVFGTMSRMPSECLIGPLTAGAQGWCHRLPSELETGHRRRHDAQSGTQRPLAAAPTRRICHLLWGAGPGDGALGCAAPRRSWCGPEPPDGGRAARPDRRAEFAHHHHGPGVEDARRGRRSPASSSTGRTRSCGPGIRPCSRRVPASRTRCST